MQSAKTAGLSAELPPLLRLAVAYAPAPARPAWVALVLFDHRLSRAVAGASSPLIGQLKLAWWRDRMRESASHWPGREPLLAALAPFDPERVTLEALVDAWEGLIDDEAREDARARLAQARAGAVAALARTLDCPADPNAIATLAVHVSRRVTGERGGYLYALRCQKFCQPVLLRLRENGQVAAVYDPHPQCPGPGDQVTKVNIELWRAPGQIQRCNPSVAQHLQDQINGICIHHLGARRSGVHVAVQAALVALVAQIDLQSVQPVAANGGEISRYQ